MKLMPPSSIKDLRGEEISRDILRTQEMEKVAKDTRIRLATAEADFSSMLSRHRITWAKEEEEHAKRLKEMNREIEILESKKIELNIPIEVIKRKADDLLKQAHELLHKNQEQEEYLESVKERLEDRLDAVAERETNLQVESSRIYTKKQGAEAQAEEVRAGVEKLSLEMKNFYEYKNKEEESIKEKKKELLLMEINLEAKIDKMKRDTDALRVYDIRLKDERGVLNSIIKKLKEINPSLQI